MVCDICGDWICDCPEDDVHIQVCPHRCVKCDEEGYDD